MHRIRIFVSPLVEGGTPHLTNFSAQIDLAAGLDHARQKCRTETVMLEGAIHNPSNPRHFMQLDPVGQKLRIHFGDLLIAESDRAMRLLEVGKRAYAPQYYIPLDDVRVALARSDRSTHCPLKGDASYFTVEDTSGTEEIGWAYEVPFEFASELSGLVAFDLRRVSITIDAAH